MASRLVSKRSLGVDQKAVEPQDEKGKKKSPAVKKGKYGKAPKGSLARGKKRTGRAIDQMKGSRVSSKQKKMLGGLPDM